MVIESFSDALHEAADRFGERPYLTELSTGLELSFAEVDRAASQFASWLTRQGLQPGDTLSFCMENSGAVPIVFLGGQRAGVTVNPLPSTLSDAELAKNICIADSTWVLLQREDTTFLSGHDVKWTLVRGGAAELLAIIKDEPELFADRSHQNPYAVKYYTSGTTASPRCILHTHAGLLWMIDRVVEVFRFSAHERHLGVLPMGHTAILAYSLLPLLRSGGHLAIAENFFKVRAQFWKLVAQLGVTYCEVVPTILFMLLNTPYDRRDIEGNRSLKYLACGSAQLSLEVQQAFQRQFGIPVANLYGTSETGPTHYDDPRAPDWVPGTIGRPLPGVECVVLRDDGRQCSPGEVGEIAVRSPSVSPGYYKNEEATRESRKGDFFLTGDLGYVDADGRWFFSGRTKDLIIKGGVNILPAELEEILHQHQSVQAAAVIGVPHKILGEDIVAFVQSKSPATADPVQLRSFVGQHLQKIKQPSRVIVVDRLPLGPSGKVLKRELRRRFMEGEWTDTQQDAS
jgi:long-chain acyl-CoA synthetase